MGRAISVLMIDPGSFVVPAPKIEYEPSFLDGQLPVLRFWEILSLISAEAGGSC